MIKLDMKGDGSKLSMPSIHFNISGDEFNRFFLEMLWSFGTISPSDYEYRRKHCPHDQIITPSDLGNLQLQLEQKDISVYDNLHDVLQKAVRDSIHCEIEDYPVSPPLKRVK